MLKGKLLGTSILKGKIQREVITISKEEQEIVIEPRTEQFDVYPDTGKVIKKATVKAVTSDIDKNIISRNIRGGVEILGVVGELEPDKPDQSKVVEPTTSEQVVTADSGYELASVMVKAIPDKYIVPSGTKDIIKNGEYDIKDYELVNVDVQPNLTTKEITANGTYNASDDGVDGYSSVSVSVGGVDKLQWKCDNLKTLEYEFYINVTAGGSATDEEIITMMNGVDTKNVASMERLFGANNQVYNKYIDLSPIIIDMSNCTNGYGMFINQSSLTKPATIINAEKLQNIQNMFSSCIYLTELDMSNWNAKNIQLAYAFLWDCQRLTKLNLINCSTSNMTSCGMMFRSCYALVEIIGVIDMIKVTSTTDMFASCRELTTVTLKNIKTNLQIGSGTSYGTKLTDDTIVNTFQELHDFTGSSTKTLTLSTPSKTRTDEIYVKLIDITDEMRAEDEYIDNKKPCVVCESTDTGAMTLKEYGISKNWNIA